MKTTKFLFALFTLLGFMLISCSEEQQSPVSPEESGSLQKVIREDYTGSDQPIGLIDPGRVKEEGGKRITQHLVVLERLETTTPMITGDMVADISATIDMVTGEGHMSGGGTVTPDDPSVSGIWHWSFQGERIKTGESEWTTTIEIVGNGQGGLIQGRQLFATGTMLSWDVLMSYWQGTVEGFMKYNEN